MSCIDIILLVVCVVFPFVVLTYDKIKYRRWYASTQKFVFLRLNTERVRDMLKGDGVRLCKCCSFKENIWLIIGPEGVVHGMGMPYEGMENLSSKEICAFDIQNAKDKGRLIVDCGTDTEKFIKEIQRYNG